MSVLNTWLSRIGFIDDLTNPMSGGFGHGTFGHNPQGGFGHFWAVLLGEVS